MNYGKKQDFKAAAPVTTAPVTTAPPVVKEVVKEVAPKKIIVRAVHGRMVDPTDGAEFAQEPKIVFNVSKWMKCQIEAKKLEIIES